MKNQFISLIVVLSFVSIVNAAITSKTNNYFTIYLDTSSGLFTIATGANHPAGAGKSVLFGGNTQDPLSTYLSIYVDGSKTEYVTADAVQNGTVLTFQSQTASGNGFASTFVTPNGAPDKFTVVSTIFVSGTTYETSVIQWKAEVTNTGTSSPLAVGIRYLWDFQIAEDDGPTFQTIDPESSKFNIEKQWNSIFFREFQMEGNRPLSAYFKVVAAAKGPVEWTPSTGINATKIAFTSWERTYQSPFDFDYRGSNIAVNSTSLEDDSCVLIYWGDRSSNFNTINVGKSYAVLSTFATESAPTLEQSVDACYDNYTCTYDYIAFQSEYGFDCLFLPMDYMCDDKNPCTEDFCDPYNYAATGDDMSGCAFVEKSCSDQIACTLDSCNTTTGECIHFDTPCADEVDCTVDVCDHQLGECTNTPADDYCQPTTVDMCHNYFCDPSIGCYSEAIVCDDDIHCTVDTCDPSSGCIFTPANFLCDDNITCTDDVCQPEIGKCVNIPRNQWCEDYDGCTTDLCDINVDCVFLEVSCKDNEMTCTQDFCMNGTCYHAAMDIKCNDQNNCTIDTCDMILGDCTNVPSDELCDDSQYCTLDRCDEEQGCVYEERNCDDEIACTDDYCDYYTQECVHSVANETFYCDDQIDCTVDSCDLDLGRCNNQADDYLCDDNDLCTVDICQKGLGVGSGCVHIPMYCNDQVDCTLDYCQDGECRVNATLEDCDDGFDCTVDLCDTDLGRCTNIPTNALCDDHVACTLDICNYTDCLNIARNSECEDFIPCTINVCQKDGCHMTLDHALCDDGIDCTYDYCDPDFGCRYVLNHTSCADEHECTENICDLQEGCVIRVHNNTCNDNITCSFEYCDAQDGCQYEYRHEYCNDDVGCTDDTCSPVVGCSNIGNHAYCSDGRECSSEYCDLDYGCVINDTNCAQDEDCEHCINCKASLTRVVVNDLEDGSGELLLNTRNTQVPKYAVASPTEGLVDNLLIKGSGQVVLGMEEFLDSNDGLVIGQSSHFRLAPTTQSLPKCNSVSRGHIQINSEQEGIEMVDHMYICKMSDNAYHWHRVY